MRYNVGDSVKIRRDLVVGNIVGDDRYMEEMDALAKRYNYILTINGYNSDCTKYRMLDDKYNWTEEMVEGLVESATPTDREKFEKWMRKLCSLDSFNNIWNAFNCCVTSEPNEADYDINLKIVADYLFGSEKKKMTKAEIEAELGYEIEIVEE